MSNSPFDPPPSVGTDPYGAAAASASSPIRWPDASAYAIAARDVDTFFVVPELQSASLRRSPLGLPLPATGRNAAVFKATIDGGDLAVRVFTRPPNDGPERYRRIGEHILPLEGVLFPNVRWLNEGVRVSGSTWPMIRMDWVEGLTLDHWVGAHLDDPNLLVDFARRWDQLFKFLEHSRIAHGDLQHGNVLVDNQHRVRLVDLDGLWIPELADHPADEYGHVHFQHPGRLTERVWGERMDGFSSLLITVSIVALSHRPELWELYNDGGNNLIFRNDDFTDLDAPIWADVAAIDNDILRRRVDKLREACQSECAKLAGPVVILDDTQRTAVVPGSPTWLLSAMGAPLPQPTPAADLDQRGTIKISAEDLAAEIAAATASRSAGASSFYAASGVTGTPQQSADTDGVPLWLLGLIAVAILVLAIIAGMLLA